MSSFVFRGYPAYLEVAARELNVPELAGPAGRLVAVARLANLCAQASTGDPLQAGAILGKAGEYRDQLAVAHRAAEAMISEVQAAADSALAALKAGAEGPVDDPSSLPETQPPARRPNPRTPSRGES